LTRSVDHILKAKPELKSHAEAWEWRLGTGVRGTSMYGVLNNQGQTRSLKVYADWTERVAKGEVPPMPPRPTGIERNLVLRSEEHTSELQSHSDLVCRLLL